MASIGTLGIGSGMDLNGLLDKIQASEQAPLAAIQQRQSAVQSRFSAYGLLQGMLASLQTSANQLAKPDFMNAFKANSSATGVLTTTADTTALGGTYAVTVSKLAKSQTLATGGVASTSAAVGATAATVTISFGKITGALDPISQQYTSATWAPNAAKAAITVNVAAGQSLVQIRDAINSAAAGAVQASIVNDGTSNHLIMTSTATGANSSIELAVTGDSAVQALLANDPANPAGQALKEIGTAQDAALTVNGMNVTSAGNTVAGAIQGVTLTLADLGSSTVTVARDTASVRGAINSFVSGYNALASKMKDLTAYSAGSKSGGVLLGDATARAVQERLRATIFQAHTGLAGDPSRLSDIGVAFQKDGTLAVDDTKLSAALSANPTGLTRLFAGNDSSDTAGLGRVFSSLIDRFTADPLGDDQDGLLAIAMSGAKKSISSLSDQMQRTQDRIDATMAQYRKQFQALDLIMSNMTATSSYLSAQFSALSGGNSKSK
jgi:flagellar hook-associated protein 2